MYENPGVQMSYGLLFGRENLNITRIAILDLVKNGTGGIPTIVEYGVGYNSTLIFIVNSAPGIGFSHLIQIAGEYNGSTVPMNSKSLYKEKYLMNGV